MKEYWSKRFVPPAKQGSKASPALADSIAEQDNSNAPATNDNDDDDEDYDTLRRRRLQNADSEDGWKVEMRRYEDDPAVEVTKDTDTVEYWAVSSFAPR